jgi:DNA-binding NarL/FixJ family response regulator
MINYPDINVLIADDHKLVRTGLRLMLTMQQKPDYNFFITEAVDGEDAISKALKKDFDIILLDYQMPRFQGDEVIARILLQKPKAKIIVLSNYDEKGFIDSCMQSGAKGYILKDIESEELHNAIDKVLDGKTYLSADVREKLYDDESNRKKIVKQLEKLGLSERELQILQLIAKEYTNEEIAKELKISRRTVDSHRQNLLYKLKAKNTAGLVKFAINNHVL